MTSAKFSGFLTHPPCLHFGQIHSTKLTQPPLLHLLLGAPNPPSHCILHMYMPPWCMAWGVAALLEGATGSKTLPQWRKVGGTSFIHLLCFVENIIALGYLQLYCYTIYLKGSSYVMHILCSFKVPIWVQISCTGIYFGSTVQRPAKRYANHAKQDPGRARQNS